MQSLSLCDFTNSLGCSRIEDVLGGLASTLTPYLRRSEAAAVCAAAPLLREKIQQGPFARRPLTGGVIQRIAIADSPNAFPGAILFHNGYLYVSSHRLEERTLSGVLVREFAVGAHSPVLAARGRHLYALGVDCILQIDLDSPDHRSHTTWKCQAGFSASVCSIFPMSEFLVSACASQLIGQALGRPSRGPTQIVWQAPHRQIRRAAPVRDNLVALYTQNRVEIVALDADGSLTVRASLELELPNFSAYHCDILCSDEQSTLVISDGRHTLLVVKEMLDLVERIELRERIYAIAVDQDGELYAKTGSTLLQLG